MLADDVMIIASVLRDGDCSAHHQMLACSQLQRIASRVRDMERALDDVVGQAKDATDAEMAAAQSERALVPLRARSRLRLVRV